MPDIVEFIISYIVAFVVIFIVLGAGFLTTAWFLLRRKIPD